MEELEPQELEDLVQEMEEEDGAEESLPSEVKVLVQDLQPIRRYSFRRRAAEQLGNISRSSLQVVKALVKVAENDSSAAIRATAVASLRAPVHQALLQQHPELGQRARSVAEGAAAARERDRQWALADETDTGQSKLAYRLAGAVLLLGALVSVVDALVSWAFDIPVETGFSRILALVIDIGLAIGLFQLRKGARTWVLIRAGAGAILWPIVLFLGSDPLTAAILSVMQWGFCGALLLLLTGESKPWRLALGVASFVVFYLGLCGLMMLLALLALSL